MRDNFQSGVQIVRSHRPEMTTDDLTLSVNKERRRKRERSDLRGVGRGLVGEQRVVETKPIRDRLTLTSRLAVIDADESDVGARRFRNPLDEREFLQAGRTVREEKVDHKRGSAQVGEIDRLVGVSKGRECDCRKDRGSGSLLPRR